MEKLKNSRVISADTAAYVFFSGYSSVRIDQKNRIVFAADEMTVIIIQCGGHYHDT